ncbi:MAG: MBL fold metallo-hydrolase, partial [Anaerolineae bacterium]|nr:MBL fold metallo-hydrolase [Anaerolineae bacterium]
LPILAWVIEHPEGLIVVDTGDTARISEPGYFPRWHPYYRFAVREWNTPEQEIGPQMHAKGLDPDDVRWVIVTHFHTDHAGGMYHFPNAEFIVARAEYTASRGLWGQIKGALPQHWPEWFQPRLIDFADQLVGAFPQSFTLTETGDMYLVPAEGHTAGQLAVLLDVDDLRYFFAADISYSQQQLLDQQVDGVALDYAAAAQTLARALQTVQAQPTIYLPSHDPDAARRLETRATVRV